MNSELGILGLYGLLTIVTILIQVLAAQAQVGLAALMQPRDDLVLTGIAARLVRAQSNAITAMALFAPAILILAQKAAFSPTTLLAAQIFLAARVAFVPLYALGIPAARTLVWLAGFLATAWLYYAGL